MIHALDLTNSGTDFACDDCLEQAIEERDGQVSAISTVFDDDDVECGWCFEPNVQEPDDPLPPSRWESDGIGDAWEYDRDRSMT